MKKRIFIEAIKYGIVGVANTLLTLAIIWLMRVVLGTPLVIANATGYWTGFVNSFILNRSWTFKGEKGDWRKEFVKFFIAFLICYSIQLCFVLFLKRLTFWGDLGKSGEIYITLLGMIVYTGTNFFLNKYYTFKVKS